MTTKSAPYTPATSECHTNTRMGNDAPVSKTGSGDAIALDSFMYSGCTLMRIPTSSKKTHPLKLIIDMQNATGTHTLYIRSLNETQRKTHLRIATPFSNVRNRWNVTFGIITLLLYCKYSITMLLISSTIVRIDADRRECMDTRYYWKGARCSTHYCH
ncbi:unnamed protein product [Albugo candida]|uniref:Uncharacterized protein n=1 Tax=Albugo candida TaxID=65357 RepID=A0A024GU01_9STRA|nr:unnamed protein product [Albugo candida]|eukprot:CCI50280.1 unnamed protein product [Albugo candida]